MEYRVVIWFLHMSLNASDEIGIGTPEARTPEAYGANAQLEKIRSALYGSSIADVLRLALDVHDGKWIPDEAVMLTYYNYLLNQRFKNNVEEIDSMGMQTMALLALRDRFAATLNLHEGCEWNRVEAALMENQGALTSLIQMELAGHEPNVYNFDKKGFDIGTCSPGSPLGGRNCVYDKVAENARRSYPNVQFNGNAVEQAKAMGISLMTEKQYNLLQTKRQFDIFRYSHTWLRTPNGIRKDNNQAHCGGRNEANEVVINSEYAYYCSVLRGWRGSLRVLWDKA